MGISNGVGNVSVSEHHLKVNKVHETTNLEKSCDKNMAGLQSFNVQEPRIENAECENITSEEGRDAIITGFFRENFDQNLTRSDKDLVDILVALGKKKKKIAC